MIASSTVNSDSSSLKSLFSSYGDAVSSIGSGDWEGASKDNLDSNANTLISTYPSAIENQMTDFASAIDKYSDYKTAKQNMESALKKIVQLMNLQEVVTKVHIIVIRNK